MKEEEIATSRLAIIAIKVCLCTDVLFFGRPHMRGMLPGSTHGPTVGCGGGEENLHPLLSDKILISP